MGRNPPEMVNKALVLQLNFAGIPSCVLFSIACGGLRILSIGLSFHVSSFSFVPPLWKIQTSSEEDSGCLGYMGNHFTHVYSEVILSHSEGL